MHLRPCEPHDIPTTTLWSANRGRHDGVLEETMLHDAVNSGSRTNFPFLCQPLSLACPSLQMPARERSKKCCPSWRRTPSSGDTCSVIPPLYRDRLACEVVRVAADAPKCLALLLWQLGHKSHHDSHSRTLALQSSGCALLRFVVALWGPTQQLLNHQHS